MQNANEEMSAAWNGVSGRAWVDGQRLLDRTYEPIERLLAREVAALGARSVLDIGCGAGATTLAAARSLGAGGRVTGIDISAPLIAVARDRAAAAGQSAAQFVRADAQTHAFEPARFDLMISRFGVMFFDDPVAAFANLRRAATPGCELRLVVFRSMAENPFMTAAERAAGPLLANLPPRKPNAPGQFAFADADRVRRILEGAWSHIALAPLDVPCTFPAADLERFFTRLGPLGQVLRDADEPTRQRVIREVRAAFDPFVGDGEVRFTAACWLICARA